jgi:RNA polymerase sigma factor (sigma-70 family)
MPSPIARMKFEVVLLTHRKQLRAKALAVCSSSSDADDLVQETIARAMVGLERLRSHEPAVIFTYLLTTMGNTFLDQIKRRRNEVLQASLHAVESQEEPEDPEVVVEYWRRLDDEDLRAAERTLSERQRQAWTLRLEGKSYKEISERMGIVSGAVGKLLFDAREKFRGVCLERLQSKQ